MFISQAFLDGGLYSFKKSFIHFCEARLKRSYIYKKDSSEKTWFRN
jgi:hypothetical protein